METSMVLVSIDTCPHLLAEVNTVWTVSEAVIVDNVGGNHRESTISDTMLLVVCPRGGRDIPKRRPSYVSFMQSAARQRVLFLPICPTLCPGTLHL